MAPLNGNVAHDCQRINGGLWEQRGGRGIGALRGISFSVPHEVASWAPRSLEIQRELIPAKETAEVSMNSRHAEAALKKEAASTEDEDLTIPRAAMNKMIKELLPNVRIANEARELILACCTEFIHHLSTEANDICNRQQKKTISADHVLGALDSLGFGAYRQDAEAVLKDCKAVAAKRRRQSTRLENLGIPEEELLRQQQELFAQARQQQAELAQQEWTQMQQVAQQQLQLQQSQIQDEDEY